MIRSLGNLRLTANGNLTHFFVTYTNMLTSMVHISAHALTCIYHGTLLYHYINLKVNIIHSFGNLFSPVRFSAQKHLTSELLRFL
jgi:hypothetical protein